MSEETSRSRIRLKGVGWFLSGVVLIITMLFVFGPGLMMVESTSKYDFDGTVDRFVTIVEESSWGILNHHDMQQVKAKLGYEVLPVKVFDLCSGQHSYRILREDDERIVTPMMPCRISIYEKSDGNTYIARMNSGLVGRLFGGTINNVMQTATKESEELIAPLLK